MCKGNVGFGVERQCGIVHGVNETRPLISTRQCVLFACACRCDDRSRCAAHGRCVRYASTNLCATVDDVTFFAGTPLGNNTDTIT